MSVLHPRVIQGGMGAGVSAWPLARAVAEAGQLGVVAGTALDVILARRLQLGDVGGHMRRALSRFPVPGVAERILARWFAPKPPESPFRALPMLRVPMTQEQEELIVAANFVEVYLAKEGHSGRVGINYLEKIQAPTLPSLFGALLAGVDYVLMGAGIPRAIPKVLDRLSIGERVEMGLDVQGADRDFQVSFDPAAFCGGVAPKLNRPFFFAIVASVTMATVMARKASGRVDGLILEGPTAGGHNAPPRGALRIDEHGEPTYGVRDQVDLGAIVKLGLPFWLAGSTGTADGLNTAIASGANGIQVGTAFAFCRESGLREDIKNRVLRLSQAGVAAVFTDPDASPTGFPFKVVQLQGSLSEKELVEQRARVCDLGYLRQAYQKPDGTLGWRCAGEPLKSYVKKGGKEEDTVGKKCVCNGLLANIGLGQVRPEGPERELVTAGNDVANVGRFLERDRFSYGVRDVLRSLGTHTG